MRAEEELQTKSTAKALPGILFAVFYALILVAAGAFTGVWAAELIQRAVFSLILGGIVSLVIRKYYPHSVTDPEISAESEKRLWIIVYISMLLSVLYSFFPNTIWVFVPLFVVLSLFSTPVIGITVASVLLAGTAIISGCGALVFFLYFVSGVFAVMVFLPLDAEMKFMMPAFLSSLCLLACEMCGIILTVNARPDVQMFILPVANCLIGIIVIYSAFRGYSSLVMFRYLDLYQNLCDTENERLLELKDEDPRTYMMSIHTAYFCERLASRLGLDAQIVKCAGFYHEMTPLNADDREEFYRDMQFTNALRILLDEYEEYVSNPGISLSRKESAVLVCSRTVVMTVMALFEKDQNAGIDTSRLVDAIFDRFVKIGTFSECEITFADLSAMKQIFKEEKLYYDFLR
ncbi:MAG: hypothetical protein K5871_02775 [Lachnospiraceae bacterium]|nr:hypothetical protein [Lachnospiraceae bacterium]